MDDLFESAHQLEQTFIEQGVEDGKRAGMQAGLEEGRELGLQKGFEIGVEVGHYAGFVRMLRVVQQQQPDLLPARVERNVAAMEECLRQFPLYDPLDESLQELLEALRGKHKAVTAALGKQQPAGEPAQAGDASGQPASLSF